MAELLRLQSSQRKFALSVGLGYKRKDIMKVTLCQVLNFIDTFGSKLDFEHLSQTLFVNGNTFLRIHVKEKCNI